MTNHAVELYSNGSVGFDLAPPPPPPHRQRPRHRPLRRTPSTTPSTSGCRATTGKDRPSSRCWSDGREVGGLQTATASHAAGEWQDVAVHGAFTTDPSRVSIQFVNDAWGGASDRDRNLYVDTITVDGHVFRAENAAHSDGFVTKHAVELFSNGSIVFDTSMLLA